jgi:hypothetical protein
LADHKLIARHLRGRGIDPGTRPARVKVPGVVLGAELTNRQAALRRRPPMKIRTRTREERRSSRWSPAELEAIAYELEAGRVTYCARGRSGLPVWSLRAAICWRVAGRRKAA